MQHARVSGLFYYQVIGYSSERVLASYYSILLVTTSFLGKKNCNLMEGKNVTLTLTLRVTSLTTTSTLVLGSLSGKTWQEPEAMATQLRT